MPEKTGKNYSLYLNAELAEKFERLQAHMNYGVSQTIANLIEVRCNELDDGVTRRQTMTTVQAGIVELLANDAKILELLQEGKDDV